MVSLKAHLRRRRFSCPNWQIQIGTIYVYLKCDNLTMHMWSKLINQVTFQRPSLVDGKYRLTEEPKKDRNELIWYIRRMELWKTLIIWRTNKHYIFFWEKRYNLQIYTLSFLLSSFARQFKNVDNSLQTIDCFLNNIFCLANATALYWNHWSYSMLSK